MSLINFIRTHHLDSKKEIIFFGGTFNPWHKGHTECIKLCDNNSPIIIIPDHNPEKEINETSINFTLLLNEIKELRENTFLFEGFFNEKKSNPTSHWINSLKDEFPTLKLSLLIGFDSFRSIAHWIEADKLISTLSSLYIASRLEDDSERNNFSLPLKEINPNINLHFLGRHPYEEVSSTQLRK